MRILSHELNDLQLNANAHIMRLVMEMKMAIDKNERRWKFTAPADAPDPMKILLNDGGEVELKPGESVELWESEFARWHEAGANAHPAPRSPRP